MKENERALIPEENVVEPRSTSTLISTIRKDVPLSELATYFMEVSGYPLLSYLLEDDEEPSNEEKRYVGTVSKVKIVALFNLIVTTAELCDAINTAIETLQLGKAIYNLCKSNGKALRVITRNYEWLSGSGNHVGYYSEVSYVTLF